MSSTNIKLLDLDAFEAGTPEVVVKLKGQEHKLAPLTVEKFIANTKLIQNMGVNGDMEQEFKVVIAMLCSAFPTMSEEDLRGLTFDQLNKLNAFAQEVSGQNKLTDEVAEDAKTNPQTAG